MLSQFLLLQKKAHHPDLRGVLSDNVRDIVAALPVRLPGAGTW